jgi:GTP-sensing pleiotropic transcriptional regulator CodY
MFDKIGRSNHVNQLDLMNLANSFKDANFQDEETVRQLVANVSTLVGIPISKDKEEEIVTAIVSGTIPLNFSTLSKLFRY